MNTAQQTAGGMGWLAFALMTVVTWGLYGLFLHTGQMTMADPVNGRYKAFLMVGVAYFLTAVLAPAALLLARGAAWTFPVRGLVWSLAAGLVGAAGAFAVLLAFGAGGSPAVVMSLVFGGAPVVNAVVALWMHPPAGGWRSISPLFYLGIVLAALGGTLVTRFKPAPASAASRPPGTTARESHGHAQ
jgi:drug/metabolite transporter (DMT)-like permease